MEIRQARSDEEALLYLEVHAQVNPGTGTLDGFRHRERTWNAVNLVALLDDEPVGSGWTRARQQHALWAAFGATPSTRARGPARPPWPAWPRAG